MVRRWWDWTRARSAGRRARLAVVALLALAVAVTVAVAATAGDSLQPHSGTAEAVPLAPEAPPSLDADDRDAGPMAASKRPEQAAAPGPGWAPSTTPEPVPFGGQPGAAGDLTGAGTDRAVTRTARLTLTVGNVPDAATRVRALATGAGGFVAGEQSSGRASTFTQRVPTDRLDEVTGRLAEVGTVTERAEQADDVTDQLADLEGRLATQRASVARVRALLERATTVGEVVSIESELSQREANLESLQRRLAALGGRVALSTLTVRLAPEAQPAADQRADTGFLGGLATGWRAFLTAGGVLLTALGVLLPFLAALGLVAGGLLLARRAVLARRRAST